ncbi:MAG: hypothetical protein DRG24_08525 [Epsilonproteobacteria bacterium]|nr:MAG: hypothetical protein DRG24_08525 [Campylobacterota bacterium]
MKTVVMRISIIALGFFLTPTSAFAMLDYYMMAILPAITAQQQSSSSSSSNEKVTMEEIINTDVEWMRVYDSYDENRGFECYSFEGNSFHRYVAKSYAHPDAWYTTQSSIGFYINEYLEEMDYWGEALFDYGPNLNFSIYFDINTSTKDRLVINNYNWVLGEGSREIWKKVSDCKSKIKPYRDVPTCTGTLPDLTSTTGQNSSSSAPTPKWNEIVIPGTFITGSDLNSGNFIFDTIGLIFTSGFDPKQFTGAFLGNVFLPLFGEEEKKDPYEETFKQINMKLDAIIDGVNALGVTTTDTNNITQNIANQIDADNMADYVSWFNELDNTSTVMREQFLSNVSQGGCDMINFLQIDITTCNALKQNIFGAQLKYPEHNGGDKIFLEAIRYYRENLVKSDGMLAKFAKIKRKELAYNLPKAGQWKDDHSLKYWLDGYNNWVIGYSLKIATYLELFFQYDLTALYLGSDLSACHSTFNYQPFFTGYIASSDLESYEKNVQTVANLYINAGEDLKNLTNSLIISDSINGINKMDPNLTTTWIPAATLDQNHELPWATSQTKPNFPSGDWKTYCTLYQYDGFDNITPPSGGFAAAYYDGESMGNIECPNHFNYGVFNFVEHCSETSLTMYKGVLGCELNKYKEKSYWDRGLFSSCGRGTCSTFFASDNTGVQCVYNPFYPSHAVSESCFGFSGTEPVNSHTMYLPNKNNDLLYYPIVIGAKELGAGESAPFRGYDDGNPRLIYVPNKQNVVEWSTVALLRKKSADLPTSLTLFYIFGFKYDYQFNGYNDYTSWFNITLGCHGEGYCVDDENPYGNTLCINGDTKLSIKDGTFNVDYDVDCS